MTEIDRDEGLLSADSPLEGTPSSMQSEEEEDMSKNQWHLIRFGEYLIRSLVKRESHISAALFGAILSRGETMKSGSVSARALVDPQC